MEVWLASMRPDTRWLVLTYGDFLDRATWMDAGPHSMKEASLRSLHQRRQGEGQGAGHTVLGTQ